MQSGSRSETVRSLYRAWVRLASPIGLTLEPVESLRLAECKLERVKILPPGFLSYVFHKRQVMPRAMLAGLPFQFARLDIEGQFELYRSAGGKPFGMNGERVTRLESMAAANPFVIRRFRLTSMESNA